MKKNNKKKGLLIIALLVAVCALGIGYAAITSINLTINGTSVRAVADDDNFKVAFDGTSSSDKTSTSKPASVTITPSVTAEEVTASYTVDGLRAKGDQVTVTFGVKNYSADLSANLTSLTSTVANTEYFEVTSAFDSASLAAGGTTNVTVTIKLIKTPIGDPIETTVTTTFTAEPVQP